MTHRRGHARGAIGRAGSVKAKRVGVDVDAGYGDIGSEGGEAGDGRVGADGGGEDAADRRETAAERCEAAAARLEAAVDRCGNDDDERRVADEARLAQALARIPSSRRQKDVAPPWLHREQRLEYWLGLVAQGVTGRLQEAFAKFGVSYAQWGAMAVLARRRHAFHMELTRVTGVSKGGVTKMMVRLEAQGLVVREADIPNTWMADSTRAPWELTPLGWSTMHVLEAIADENEAHGFGHLSPAERRALDLGLRRLAHHHGWGVSDGEDAWRDIRREPGEGPQVSAPSPARRRLPLKR